MPCLTVRLVSHVSHSVGSPSLAFEKTKRNVVQFKQSPEVTNVLGLGVNST